MLRKESEAVPEGNGPVPQQEELESGQPTLEDVYRRIKKFSVDGTGSCTRWRKIGETWSRV